MFEEEDEDDYDYEMSEIEEWYEDNFGYFIEDAKIEFGVPLDVVHFYNEIYCPTTHELKPLVRRLMMKQYPIIDTEFRPKVLEEIDWTASRVGHELLMQLSMLMRDQRNGVNLREKYPNFERWIDFYARPPEAPVPDYAFFDKYPDLRDSLTEEQKKEIAEETCADETIRYDTFEKLKKEFYDLIQPVIFKYYTALLDLDYDGWVVYALDIREIYEDYIFRCEHLYSFIDYEFPEEDIDLDYKEFEAKRHLRFKERWDKEHPE